MKRPIISIIIPLYNTPISFFKECLDSISNQLFKNFEVIIINDFSTIDYQELLDEYCNKFCLKSFKLDKNVGPGIARQIGIEKSKGAFITFLDADDQFYDEGYLAFLIKEFIDDQTTEISQGYIIEELSNEKKILQKPSSIWCFGKLFSRDFLIKNNLKFNKSRENEDNAFCTLAYSCAKKIKTTKYSKYFWRYNQDSITRKNNYSFYLDTIPAYIDNMIWIFTEACKRNRQYCSFLITYMNNTYFYLYIILLQYLYFYNEEQVKNIIEKIRQFYIKCYIYYENKISKELFNKNYFLQIKSCAKELEKIFINISFPQFEDLIKSNKNIIYNQICKYHN